MTEQEAIKYLKDANRNNQMIGVLPKSDIGKCLINALEEIQKYRAIGTPEECLAAMKKQKEKKVLKPLTSYSLGTCPVCTGHQLGRWEHCMACGQKLDWSDVE